MLYCELLLNETQQEGKSGIVGDIFYSSETWTCTSPLLSSSGSWTKTQNRKSRPVSNFPFYCYTMHLLCPLASVQLVPYLICLTALPYRLYLTNLSLLHICYINGNIAPCRPKSSKVFMDGQTDLWADGQTDKLTQCRKILDIFSLDKATIWLCFRSRFCFSGF